MAVKCAVVEHGTEQIVDNPDHCLQLSSPEAAMARLDRLRAPVAVIVKHRVLASPLPAEPKKFQAKRGTTLSSNCESPRTTTAHTEQSKSINIDGRTKKCKTEKKSSRRMQSISLREEDLDMIVSSDPLCNVFEVEEDNLLGGRLSSSFHILMSL